MFKLNKKCNLILLVLLVLQPYIKAELFSVIIFGLDFIFLLRMKRINKDFFSIIAFAGILIFTGIISLIFWGSGLTTRDIFRDFYYLVNAISVFFLGFSLVEYDNNIEKYYNSIVLSGILIGCVTCIKYLSLLNTTGMNFNDLRSAVDTGHIYACSLSIILYLFYFKNKSCILLPKIIYCFSFIISVVTVVLAFSRTNLLIVFIFTFLFVFISKQRIRLKTIVAMVIALLICYILLDRFIPNNIINTFINKIFSSFSEISTNYDWNDLSVIQSNWRGFENACAIEQFMKGNILEQLFGYGFGQGIYVKGYAYLVLGSGQNNLYIQVLHNGYLTLLIKNGLVGLISYIIFYFHLFVISLKKTMKHNQFSNIFLLGCTISLIVITYFLNGLFKDTYILSIIILIPITLGVDKGGNPCKD